SGGTERVPGRTPSSTFDWLMRASPRPSCGLLVDATVRGAVEDIIENAVEHVVPDRRLVDRCRYVDPLPGCVVGHHQLNLGANRLRAELKRINGPGSGS